MSRESQFAKKVGDDRQAGILSLSVCFNRCEVLRHILQEHVDAQKESIRLEQPEFTRRFKASIRQVNVTPISRFWALSYLFYASLYVVIEGWGKLELTDQEITDLLGSQNVRTLKDFRNAVFHPNHFGEQRVTTFLGTHTELRPWAVALSNAFSRYFRKWAASTESSAAPWGEEPGA
jgi:hypothetical protein